MHEPHMLVLQAVYPLGQPPCRHPPPQLLPLMYPHEHVANTSVAWVRVPMVPAATPATTPLKALPITDLRVARRARSSLITFIDSSSLRSPGIIGRFPLFCGFDARKESMRVPARRRPRR